MFTHTSSLRSSLRLSISEFMDTLEKTCAALRHMCLGRLPRLSSMFDALPTFLGKEPLQSTRNDTTSTLLSNEQGKYPILTNSTYILLSLSLSLAWLTLAEHSCTISSIQDERQPTDSHNDHSDHPQIQNSTLFTADHMIVVLKSDIEEERFLSPPWGCRFIRVPDRRVAFVMMFSNKEFEEWKILKDTPRIYPHNPTFREDEVVQSQEINLEHLEHLFPDILNPMPDISEPIRDAAKRAFEALRRVESQVSRGQQGLGKDVQGNTLKKTGGSGTLQTSTENLAHSKESFVERESTVHSSLNTGRDVQELLALGVFVFPRSQIVRMFIIRRFVNREVRRERNEQKKRARQIVASKINE